MKVLLVSMENQDATNTIRRFSVSWMTINVFESPITSSMCSWNLHRLPCQSGGIPSTKFMPYKYSPPILDAFCSRITYFVSVKLLMGHLHMTVHMEQIPFMTLRICNLQGRDLRMRDYRKQHQKWALNYRVLSAGTPGWNKADNIATYLERLQLLYWLPIESKMTAWTPFCSLLLGHQYMTYTYHEANKMSVELLEVLRWHYDPKPLVVGECRRF